MNTTYGYDSAGRMNSIDYSDDTPDVRRSYRRDGGMTGMIDAAGEHTYSDWSPMGTATMETVADSSGGQNLLSGLVWRQTVDDLGRPSNYQGSFVPSGSPPILIPATSFTYQDHGRLSRVARGSLLAQYTRASASLYNTGITRTDSLSSQLPFLSATGVERLRGTVIATHRPSGLSVIQGRGINPNVAGLITSTDPNYGTNSSINSYRYVRTNTRGEVTQMSTGFSPTFKIPGWDAVYSYDDIGNRISSGAGTSSSAPNTTSPFTDLEMTDYTPNELNQYEEVEHPRTIHVTGFSPAGQTVTVNGATATRQSHAFDGVVTATGTGPVWQQVIVESSTASPPTTATSAGYRYVPPAEEALSYDEDGNLTQDGRWDYEWDGENRLRRMTTTSAAATEGVPNLKLEFQYDGYSRRIQKKRYKFEGSTWDLQSDTRFIYHGWNLIAEIEMDGSATDAPATQTTPGPFLRRSYLWGEDLGGSVGGELSPTRAGAGGVGGLLAVTRHDRGVREAETFWATWDLNGNVIGLRSSSTTRSAVYEYDAFGNPLRVNEPAVDLCPIRFSSKYADEESGSLYFGHRYYGPLFGRWQNRDPALEVQPNIYNHTNNGLLTSIDVLGLFLYVDYAKGYVDPLTKLLPASGSQFEPRFSSAPLTLAFLKMYARATFDKAASTSDIYRIDRSYWLEPLAKYIDETEVADFIDRPMKDKVWKTFQNATYLHGTEMSVRYAETGGALYPSVIAPLGKA